MIVLCEFFSMIFNIVVEEFFELKKGWALKGKQKYGIRGKGKRMSKRVRSYLEGYFLTGNENKTNRMTAKEMVSQLQDLANEGEIQAEDVPEVATVANWITHYAANLKESSKRMVEKTSSTRNIENSTRTDDRETEEIGNNNEQVEHIVEECVIRGRVKKTFSNNDNFSNEHLTKRYKKSK